MGQKGFVRVLPLLLIVASVGVIAFLLLTSTAPFGDKFLSKVYNKQPSFAATDTISVSIDANSNVHSISPYIYGQLGLVLNKK
jgi:hypothetical protein